MNFITVGFEFRTLNPIVIFSTNNNKIRMNATKNHIGKNKNTHRRRTVEVISTVRQICSLDSKAKDIERNSERQTEICSNKRASNGFLKCRFLPKHEQIVSVQDCKEVKVVERNFYKSLSKISKQYGVAPIETGGFAFPYNLALAVWDLKAKMKRINEDWSQFKLIRYNEEIHFAIEEQFSTNTSLYFIPIVPLFQMLQDKKRKKNAQLLLSVCSYLYHIADVPYYRQQNSYLYWIYEMHEGWMEEVGEDSQLYWREFQISKNIGDRMDRKILNTKNLDFFEERLNNFKIKSTFDQDCQNVASEAFALYSEYPKTTIFQNKPSSVEDVYNDDYCNKAIGMDMYISFVANTNGCLYNNIEDSINAEFNEYGSIEEPTIYTPINGTTITKADFNFETRFFTMMEDLHKVLTD